MSRNRVVEGEITELTYSNIEAFMGNYFKDYSVLVNSPSTIDKLDIYYSADFCSTAYMNTPGTGEYPFTHKNREMFKNFLRKGHENTKEILSPMQLSIDERKGKVAAILDVRKEDRTTGDKSQFIAIAIYGVGLENNSIRLKSLNICVDNPQKIAGTWKQR